MFLDAESGIEARGAVGQLVIDASNLGAKAAEVNRYIGNKPLFLESAYFREQTLALAQGKDGNEHRTIVFQNLADGIGKAAHFLGSRIFSRALGAAVGAFHDEDIDAARREISTGNECLVVELHITGVENGGAAFAFELYAAAAENMPRIMQGGQHASVATDAEG